jgi:hypothetical protein
MATSNFLTINTKNIYAIKWDGDVEKTISKLQYKGTSLFDFIDYRASCYNNNHRFEGENILYKEYKTSSFPKIEANIYIDIEIVVRNGYYENGNLDFDLVIEDDYGYKYHLSDYYGNIASFADDIANSYVELYFEDYKEHENEINEYKAFLEHEFEEACNYANNVLKALCNEAYQVIGTFNNGACVYEKL